MRDAVLAIVAYAILVVYLGGHLIAYVCGVPGRELRVALARHAWLAAPYLFVAGLFYGRVVGVFPFCCLLGAVAYGQRTAL